MLTSTTVQSMGSRAARPARSPVVARAAFTFPNLFRRPDKTAQRTAVKQELLDLLPSLRRGLKANEDDKARVEAAAASLEKLNPTAQPLTSPLLNGQWRLLYTTSASILGTSRLPPFRPFGEIYQILDNENLKARNQETQPFWNSVSADLTPISNNAVKVQFKTFKIGGIIPVQAPQSAVGELAITYLDEDLRVSRGDKGNLFILEMDDREARP